MKRSTKLLSEKFHKQFVNRRLVIELSESDGNGQRFPINERRGVRRRCFARVRRVRRSRAGGGEVAASARRAARPARAATAPSSRLGLDQT